jgi:hypothetical protein
MNKKSIWAISTAAVFAVVLITVAVIRFTLPGVKIPPKTDQKESELTPSIDYGTEMLKLAWTFEQYVAASTHIVQAEYLGEYKNEMGRLELMFRPKEIMKGNLTEDLIYVLPFYSEYSAFHGEFISEGKRTEYVEGEQYLLLLQKNYLVFYEHAQYLQVGEFYFPKNMKDFNEKYTLVKNLAATQKNIAPESYGREFTLSEDINEILKYSDNIFWVKIISDGIESRINPTTLYDFEVLKVLKGKPSSEYSIGVAFFNGTVKPGGEYIILLADSEEGSRVNTLSSRNSIYSCEALDKLPPELKALLETATDFETKPNPTYEELLEQERAGAK